MRQRQEVQAVPRRPGLTASRVGELVSWWVSDHELTNSPTRKLAISPTERKLSFPMIEDLTKEIQSLRQQLVELGGHL
jgi:hypothetical protein